MQFRSRVNGFGNPALALAVGISVGLLLPRANVVRSDLELQPVAGVETEQDTSDATGRALSADAPLKVASPKQTPNLAQRVTRWSVAVRAGPAYGAGVLLGRKQDEGLVLTALHVVTEESVRVRMPGAKWRTGTVVARDSDSDLALVRVKTRDRRPAPITSVLEVRPGERVLSVGNPRQLRFSVSRGIISYVGRSMRGMRYIQTDLSVYPGSSGGPVFDERGRLVGIMSFALRGSERIGFVLPVDYALERFAAELKGARASGADLTRFRQWARAGDTLR
jgi:S1-C subfamily serine protease